jgi:hypothetical protein
MPTPFYDYADIIEWAKISQALALVGEKKKRATTGSTVDEDLHIKIYDTRKAVEHLYDEDNDSDDLYEMANYLYALCNRCGFLYCNSMGGWKFTWHDDSGKLYAKTVLSTRIAFYN